MDNTNGTFSTLKLEISIVRTKNGEDKESIPNVYQNDVIRFRSFLRCISTFFILLRKTKHLLNKLMSLDGAQFTLHCSFGSFNWSFSAEILQFEECNMRIDRKKRKTNHKTNSDIHVAWLDWTGLDWSVVVVTGYVRAHTNKHWCSAHTFQLIFNMPIYHEIVLIMTANKTYSRSMQHRFLRVAYVDGWSRESVSVFQTHKKSNSL